MAPTIIRVKRKFDDSQDIDTKIVLNCKKQKINDKDVYSQFSFVGTVEEKEDVIPDHIFKLSKREAENIVQSKTKDGNSPGLNSRLSENFQQRKDKRFKVVNFLRRDIEKSSVSSKGEQIILDVERDEGSNKTESEEISKSNFKESYVYDIYVAQDDFSTVLQADMIDLNDLSILDYNDYLYSCPRLTNDDEELHDDYDEDSNDENNWRNDYPDEEEFSDSSIDERAMRKAMQNFDIDNELSSDEENDYEDNNGSKDGFVYSIDTEEYGFDGDYDYGDAEKCGTSYARYRKKMLRDLEGVSDNSTESEDE